MIRPTNATGIKSAMLVIVAYVRVASGNLAFHIAVQGGCSGESIIAGRSTITFSGQYAFLYVITFVFTAAKA